jgi:hypothetical protein
MRAMHSVVVLLLSLWMMNGITAEFRLVPLDPESPGSAKVVVVSDRIQRGDYDKLRDFAKSDARLFHARTFILASPGGDAEEAMKIGQLLRRIYAPVFVSRNHGPCASACFLIYVAAVDRNSMSLSLGIHRPYLDPKEWSNLPLSVAERRHREMSEMVRSYLHELQVPQSLVEKMFNLASTEIHWLEGHELEQLGLRSPWWDQMLVSRCKLNKRLEYAYLRRERSEEVSAAAEKHFDEVAKCAYELSADDRDEAVRRFLAERPAQRKP